MPSIPQSLLWISLVVLWLFVLVPMLVSKRDAVRRTSDVALATRVLNNSTAARLIKRAASRPPGIAATPTGSPKKTSYDDLRRRRRADERRGGRRRRRASSPRSPRRCPAEETAPTTRRRRDRPRLGRAARRRRRGGRRDRRRDTDTEVNSRHRVRRRRARRSTTRRDQYEYIDDTSGIPIAEEQPLRAATASDRRHRFDPDKAAALARPQVRLPQAGADGHGVDVGALGDDGVPADLLGLVASSASSLSRPCSTWDTCASRPGSRSGCGAAGCSGWRARSWAWRTPTTASTTSFRRGCGVPARWSWRSTTKTRSSSTSTTRRTRGSTAGTCRGR